MSVLNPTKNVLQKYRISNKSQNKDIFITRPAKGNRVVIVDRWLYVCRMYDIFSDMSKFLKLSLDPTLCREGKLQRFLCALKNKGFSLRNSMITSLWLPPARIFGTPKTHKLEFPTNTLMFHPTISA